LMDANLHAALDICHGDGLVLGRFGHTGNVRE
jgi:hypothetical protein